MSLFINLPPELHILIATFLPICDYIQFRLTCAYFYDLVPRPSHQQLLQAESTKWARCRDLYTCRYCCRLRPACHFADRMLNRRRSRSGRDSGKRFCIDCGLMPRDGMARYGPGAQVMAQGEFLVLCLTCGHFKPGACDKSGRHTSYCQKCWRVHEARRDEGSPLGLYQCHTATLNP